MRAKRIVSKSAGNNTASKKVRFYGPKVKNIEDAK